MKLKAVKEKEVNSCRGCIFQNYTGNGTCGKNILTIDGEVYRCAKDHVIYKEVKEDKMSNKEKALKELDQIKERMVELERIIKADDIKTYPVKHSVGSKGEILFNGCKQSLTVNSQGLYIVYSVNCDANLYIDYSVAFVWIPCKREDLNVGDTAYRTDMEILDNEATGICKILNNDEYVSVDGKETYLGRSNWNNWYKLVKKSEL